MVGQLLPLQELQSDPQGRRDDHSAHDSNARAWMSSVHPRGRGGDGARCQGRWEALGRASGTEFLQVGRHDAIQRHHRQGGLQLDDPHALVPDSKRCQVCRAEEGDRGLQCPKQVDQEGHCHEPREVRDGDRLLLLRRIGEHLCRRDRLGLHRRMRSRPRLERQGGPLRGKHSGRPAGEGEGRRAGDGQGPRQHWHRRLRHQRVHLRGGDDGMQEVARFARAVPDGADDVGGGGRRRRQGQCRLDGVGVVPVQEGRQPVRILDLWHRDQRGPC
mmetsp:Transcript_9398/g.26807  ORF Transcript_9398/g.26807 Transcript_9398/m.26807 type:complete len:273 (-) Transcript_9398:529-1347(-)